MTQKLYQTQAVPRHDHLSKEDFIQQFIQPKKPVVTKSFAKDWPALDKWSYNFLKKGCGNTEVPLYNEAFAGSGNDYLSSNNNMPFGDYLDTIQAGPTPWRMFLFNIFQHMPNLCGDFDYPDLPVTWLKKFPFVFFGGQGAYVDIHYDLDHSHVFLTQFEGTKKILLFEPQDSTQLYRHPFTVSCNIDFRDPDFNKYPALKNLTAYECTVQKGDTLFIPSKWWHFVDYTTGGFSLSLRALPQGILPKAAGAWSVAKLKLLDNNISKIVGPQKWYDTKEKWAHRRVKKLNT